MIEFFNMGGYGSFIWPSWGLGLGVLAVITIISRRQAKAIAAKLNALSKDNS